MLHQDQIQILRESFQTSANTNKTSVQYILVSDKNLCASFITTAKDAILCVRTHVAGSILCLCMHGVGSLVYTMHTKKSDPWYPQGAMLEEFPPTLHKSFLVSDKFPTSAIKYLSDLFLTLVKYIPLFPC